MAMPKRQIAGMHPFVDISHPQRRKLSYHEVVIESLHMSIRRIALRDPSDDFRDCLHGRG
jgi:hypothetical protein